MHSFDLSKPPLLAAAFFATLLCSACSQAVSQKSRVGGAEPENPCSLNASGSSRSNVLARNGIQLVTQTDEERPSDRSRTLLGIAEGLKLYLQPEVKSEVNWSIEGQGESGPGTLDRTKGNSVHYVAPDRCARTVIAATFESAANGTPEPTTLSVEINVIEPTGAVLKVKPDIAPYHRRGYPSAGFRASVYITPSNVSFMNVLFYEGSVPAKAEGYFAGENGLLHRKGDVWWPSEHKDGMGTHSDHDDKVCGDTRRDKPYSAGSFIWDIPWYFQVGVTGKAKAFTTMRHSRQIAPDGTVTITKGDWKVDSKDHARVRFEVDAPDSGDPQFCMDDR